MADHPTARTDPNNLPGTHVFLTHDWGTDERGRDNHARVAVFNRGLQQRGYVTWFDSERMSGDIQSQMASGIDNTCVVVVFVTQRYCEKVAAGGDDNCGMEFSYAHNRKGVRHMMPIVMEPRMRDTKRWHGALALALNRVLYYDCSDDSLMDSCLDATAAYLMERTSVDATTLVSMRGELREQLENYRSRTAQILRHSSEAQAAIDALANCLDTVNDAVQVDAITLHQMKAALAALDNVFASICQPAASLPSAAESSNLVESQQSFSSISATLQARIAARNRAKEAIREVALRQQAAATAASLAAPVPNQHPAGSSDEADLDYAPEEAQWPANGPSERDVLMAYLNWLIEVHSKMDVKIAGVVTMLDLDDVYIALRGDPASAFERKQAKALLDREVQQQLSQTALGQINDELLQAIRRRLLMSQPVTMVQEAQGRQSSAADNNQSTGQPSTDNNTEGNNANQIADAATSSAVNQNEVASKANKEDGVDVKAAFAKHPWLVILGNPGGGKTTVCRFLALTLAKEYLAQVQGGSSGSACILPLMLRVSEFARHSGQTPNLFQFLGSATWNQRRPNLEGQSISPDLLQRLFVRHMRRGQTAVILDGLDEITDARQRALVVQAVDSFSADWMRRPGTASGNQIVVTSRIAGYHSAPLEHPAFVHFTILPLQASAVERFCHAWMRAVYKAEEKQALFSSTASPEAQAAAAESTRARADKEAADLMAKIKDPERTGLQELSSTPLLLSALCSMYHAQGRALPDRRVQIYEFFVTRLIEVWKVKSTSAQTFSPEKMVPILCSLARRIHENSSTGLIETSEVRKEFISELCRLQPALTEDEVAVDVDNWLRVARDEVGILAAHGEDLYGFVHLTFQEFLAAMSIVRDPDAVNLILDRLPDPRWREPLLLAMGYASYKWQAETFATFLENLLTASSTGEQLMPRGAILLGMAIKEMVHKPDDAIIDQALLSLLRAAVSSVHYNSQELFIDVAKQLLTSLDSDQMLTRIFAVAEQLTNDDLCNLPLAALAGKLNLRNSRLVEVLWPRMHLDRRVWGWPVRKLVLDHPQDVLLRSIPAGSMPFRTLLLHNSNLSQHLLKNPTMVAAIVAVYGGVDLKATNSNEMLSPACFVNDSPLTPLIEKWLQPFIGVRRAANVNGELPPLQTDQLCILVAEELARSLKNGGSPRLFADGILLLLAARDWTAVETLVRHPAAVQCRKFLVDDLHRLRQDLLLLQDSHLCQLHEMLEATFAYPKPTHAALQPYLLSSFARLTMTSILNDVDLKKDADISKQVSALYVPARSLKNAGFQFACLLQRCVEDVFKPYWSCVVADTELQPLLPPHVSTAECLQMLNDVADNWIEELRLWPTSTPSLHLQEPSCQVATALHFMVTVPPDIWPIRLTLQATLHKVAPDDPLLSPWLPLLKLLSVVRGTDLLPDSSVTEFQALVEELDRVSDSFVRVVSHCILAQVDSSMIQRHIVADLEAALLMASPEKAAYAGSLLLALSPEIVGRHSSAVAKLLKRMLQICKRLTPVSVVRLLSQLSFATTDASLRADFLKRIAAALKTMRDLELALALRTCRSALQWGDKYTALWQKNSNRLTSQPFLWAIALDLDGKRFIGGLQLSQTLKLWPWSTYIRHSSAPWQAVTRILAGVHDAVTELALPGRLVPTAPWTTLLDSKGTVNMQILESLLNLGITQRLTISAPAAVVMEKLLKSSSVEARQAASKLLAVVRDPVPCAMPLVEKWMSELSKQLEPVIPGRVPSRTQADLTLIGLLSLEAEEAATLTAEACECLYEALGSSDDVTRQRFEAATKFGRKHSRMSTEAFFAIAALVDKVDTNPTPKLLFGWMLEQTVMDNAEVIDSMLAEATKNLRKFSMMKNITPLLLLKVIAGLVPLEAAPTDDQWAALFITLFRCSNPSPNTRSAYSVWTATLVAAVLGLPKVDGEASSQTEDRSEDVASPINERAAKAEFYASIAGDRETRLRALSGSVDSHFKAAAVWALGYNVFSQTGFETFTSLLQSAQQARDRWSPVVLATALLWFGDFSPRWKPDHWAKMQPFIFPFLADKDVNVKRAAMCAMLVALAPEGIDGDNLNNAISNYSLAHVDLLHAGLLYLSRNTVFAHSDDDFAKLVVDLIERHAEQLLPVFLKACFEGIRESVTLLQRRNDPPLQRIKDMALTILQGDSPLQSFEIAAEVFARMPAACNMFIRSNYMAHELHELLSRAGGANSFPLRQAAVTILSYLDNVQHVDLGGLLAACAMDVRYVRDSAFEAAQRLRHLPTDLTDKLQKTLQHPSGTAAYFAGTCLQAVAGSRRCSQQQRGAIIHALEAAVRHSHKSAAGVLVVDGKGKDLDRLDALVYRMLVTTASNLRPQVSQAPVRLFRNAKIIMRQPNKRFSIKCMFGTVEAPFTFVVGEPLAVYPPLHMQRLYLWIDRGGNFPHDVLQALKSIRQLARRNNLPYPDLVVYAMGLATQTGPSD